MPINHNKSHWSLVIVCFPGAILEEEITRQCCILGFDSRKRFRSATFDLIKTSLNLAWSSRASERQLPFAFKRCIALTTPKQNNFADSGVFMLHNCEKFFDQGGIGQCVEAFLDKILQVKLLKRDTNFANDESSFPGAKWYRKSEIAQKRLQILELIKTTTGRITESMY